MGVDGRSLGAVLVIAARPRLGLCLLLVVAGNAALAQDRKAEQAIKHRRAAFTLMSTYFSRLLQTVEGDRPFDPVLVAKDARLVDFKRLTVELQARTADLSKATVSGNLARIKVAFEQTREVCKACHKEFRKK